MFCPLTLCGDADAKPGDHRLVATGLAAAASVPLAVVAAIAYGSGVMVALWVALGAATIALVIGAMLGARLLSYGALLGAEREARTELTRWIDRSLAEADVERRTIEDDRRLQVETLEAVAHVSPAAIVCVTRDCLVTLWNPAAERLFGYRAEEIVGRPYPLVPDEDRAEVERLIDLSLTGEIVRNFHTRRRHVDGRLIEVTVQAAPLRLAPDGRGTALVFHERATIAAN